MKLSTYLNRISVPYSADRRSGGVMLSLLQREQHLQAVIGQELEPFFDERICQLDALGNEKLDDYYELGQLAVVAQYWLTQPDQQELRETLTRRLIREGYPSDYLTYEEKTPAQRVIKAGAYAAAELGRLHRAGQIKTSDYPNIQTRDSVEGVETT
jgi:hypothetical protein